MPVPTKHLSWRRTKTAVWVSLALTTTAVAAQTPSPARNGSPGHELATEQAACADRCEIVLDTPPRTLAQALDLAWTRHPQAAAMSALQAEAQARTEQASGLTPAPSAVSLDQKTDRLHGNAGLREWEVELATPLWLPGQRAARLGEATRHAQELDARAADLRWQLAGEIREAWWAVAAAREARKLAGQQQDTARALAASVQRRVDKGDLARLDANLAQGERLNAEAEALEADKALRQAEQAFRNLTGQDAPALLTGETPPQAPLDAPDPAPASLQAADHPQLQRLRAASALADSRVALADASRRAAPELALRWISERSEAARPAERSVGIRLTWPLSSSSQVGQAGAAARAESAQTDAELKLAQTRVEQGITRARLELDAAGRVLAMARERQHLAVDTLQLAQRSFDLGESDLPALLRARKDARDADTAVQHRGFARELALSRLLQAQGVWP